MKGSFSHGTNVRRLCMWVLNAAAHGVAIFYGSLWIWASLSVDTSEVASQGGWTFVWAQKSAAQGGEGYGLSVLGSATNFNIVVVANLKLALEMRMHSLPQHACIWLCCASWFLTMYLWDRRAD